MWSTLENVETKLKTHLQNGSTNCQFCEDRTFSSRGLFVEKSVFLTGRVLRAVPDKTQKLTVGRFQVATDALIIAVKNVVPEPTVY